MLVWLFRARPVEPSARAAWVLKFLWPMYLVHQFEEHGIDGLGRHYAFLGELCATLGHPDLASCPADPGFIFAVNGLGCWFAFALPFVYGKTKPLVAACAWGIPIVNAVTHIASAIAHGAYNPGVLTSVVLFVPMSLWMLRTCLREGAFTRRDIPRIVATGGLTHAVLLASLVGRMHGLPYALFFGINVVNGAWPLVLGRRTLARKSRADILGQ